MLDATRGLALHSAAIPATMQIAAATVVCPVCQRRDRRWRIVPFRNVLGGMTNLQPRFGPFADWLSATAKMTIPPRAMCC